MQNVSKISFSVSWGFETQLCLRKVPAITWRCSYREQRWTGPPDVPLGSEDSFFISATRDGPAGMKQPCLLLNKKRKWQLEKPGHLYLKSDCWGKLHDQGSNDCAWGNSRGEQLSCHSQLGWRGDGRRDERQTKRNRGGGREGNGSTNEIASLYSFSCILISLFFFKCIIQERSFSSFFSRRNITLIFKIERSWQFLNKPFLSWVLSKEKMSDSEDTGTLSGGRGPSREEGLAELEENQSSVQRWYGRERDLHLKICPACLMGQLKNLFCSWSPPL